MDKKPRVGVGVYIIKDRKILMGKRIGPHGKNTWSPPGGWLEFNESWDDCAKREAMEEAGVKIKNLRFWTITNDIPADKHEHVVTIHILADYDSGNPKIMEQDKWEEWNWFSWDELPKPLFLSNENLLKQNLNPFST